MSFNFPVPVLFAAGMVGLSLMLLWWAVAGRRKASVAASDNLRRGGGTDLHQLVLSRSAGDRAVKPVVAALARKAIRLTPVGWMRSLERRVVLAGEPARWPTPRVLAVKFVLGVAGLAAGFYYISGHRSLVGLLIGIGVTALGFFVPDLLLYNQAQKRQIAIQDELADTIDQITVSVEAGLGFEAALSRAARTGTGPLAEELTRTLQEMQVGVPRDQALRNLVDRTDVADLRHFVFALLQAQKHGVSISQVLRVQTAELRVKRRQRAEEKAMKIPVKILFPLLTCIFPVIFIVLLGPAAIQISRNLFGVL
jgi:tight adherence protein C